ncbi:hypothetical protein HHI36_016401 [Cryptolaemus montrouzieri]|uniref:F-BAR domain-containing protein n=1 Tax=Cryptolaemus montrouzieri TaxID=559131 RepID=A0ABD2NJD6_9CUCU
MVKMLFSENLQGKIGHDAILSRQEAELRLLELMRRCLISKVKCDKEYAVALSAVATQGLKIDKSDELCGSAISNSWKVMMEELDNSGKLIKQNAESVEAKVLDALNTLYAEKKRIRKLYQEDYTKIQQQLTNERQALGKRGGHALVNHRRQL